MNINSIISDILATNKITQEELAKQLGVTPVALSRWMTGKSIPRKDVFQKLLNAHADADIESQKTTDFLAFSIHSELLSDDMETLIKNELSEKVLKKLAILILEDAATSWQARIQKMLLSLPLATRQYDWNIGSLIQHFPAMEITKIFKTISHTQVFYNSIGLAWVFGEYGAKDTFIIEYLRSVVRWSSNSDAWWRAAFSLEKLGSDEAVCILKRSLRQNPLKDLNFYLDNLNNKKSLIATLLLCNADNIESKIYPKLKSSFLHTKDRVTLINCCWLIGRLGLLDSEIFDKLLLMSKSDDYEVKYYTFFALQHNTSAKLRPMLETAMKDSDVLVRKIAVRALRSIGKESSLPFIEAVLNTEQDPGVVSELSQAIYLLKNPNTKAKILLEQKAFRNENGLIIDESDKWYRDPSVYDSFSQAEDPQNICFDIIKSLIAEKEIINPIDLAMGTGRMMWQIMDKFFFKGTLTGIDTSNQMCEYVSTAIRRGRKFTHNVKIIKSSIADTPKNISGKSSFIISSFGFPSRITDTLLCLKELKAVHELLSDDGIFVTIGWDETFNDELNEMWFKHIPDSICASSFEEWRQIRLSSILSPRNCSLAWYKKGILVPLQFSSLEQSAVVMGYLFGRDAAQYIINNKKTEWLMSLGITVNSKKEIKEIINAYEKRN